MPSRSKHENKVQSNQRFLDAIAPTVETAADWVAVVAFYTAVHLVETLRALDNEHSRDHFERLEYVQKNHRDIHHPFRSLFDVSKLARYEANAVFFRQFSPDRVRAEVLNEWLRSVREYVEAFVARRDADGG